MRYVVFASTIMLIACLTQPTPTADVFSSYVTFEKYGLRLYFDVNETKEINLNNILTTTEITLHHFSEVYGFDPEFLEREMTRYHLKIITKKYARGDCNVCKGYWNGKKWLYGRYFGRLKRVNVVMSDGTDKTRGIFEQVYAHELMHFLCHRFLGLRDYHTKSSSIPGFYTDYCDFTYGKKTMAAKECGRNTLEGQIILDIQTTFGHTKRYTTNF